MACLIGHPLNQRLLRHVTWIILQSWCCRVLSTEGRHRRFIIVLLCLLLLRYFAAFESSRGLLHLLDLTLSAHAEVSVTTPRLLLQRLLLKNWALKPNSLKHLSVRWVLHLTNARRVARVLSLWVEGDELLYFPALNLLRIDSELNLRLLLLALAVNGLRPRLFSVGSRLKELLRYQLLGLHSGNGFLALLRSVRL